MDSPDLGGVVLSELNNAMKRVKAEGVARSLALLLAMALGAPSWSVAAGSGENEFLDLDISELLAITVTSVAKKAQNLGAAAAAVHVITSDDIKRSGVTSIPEALAMAPGIYVAQISASKWAVSSRGFSGYSANKLLVLIDGRSVYSPAYSGVFWDMQDVLLEDIDRIEVIRGPGGTLWGANAVNGVINIITKKVDQNTQQLARVTIGDQNQLLGGARAAGQLGKDVYCRFSASYEDRGANSLKTGGAGAGDDWSRFHGGFRSDGLTGENSEWMLAGDITRSDQDQQLYPYWNDSEPFLSSHDSSVATSAGSILGRYIYSLRDNGKLALQTYFDHSDREEKDFYRMVFDTFDIDLQYQLALSDTNNLTIGAGFREIKGDFDGTFQIDLADRTDDLYSMFIQDELSLIPDVLSITAGTKWENYEYSGNDWQPSVRVSWRPMQRHSLWASIGRAVRTPSMVENDGVITMGVYSTGAGANRMGLIGNDQFGAEKLVAYETGYRWQMTRELAVDLALFYNDYEELYSLLPVRDESGYNLYLVNGVSGHSAGAELGLDWQPRSWLTFQLAYSYLDMNLSEEETDIVESSLDDTSPRHQVSLRTTLQLAADWQCNFWLRYLDQITARNSANLADAEKEVIDDYFLLSANLIWRVKKNLELMLAGQNLLEDRRLQYISEFISPPAEIERGFYLKATYRF